MVVNLPVSDIELTTTWRIISSRYPRVSIFEQVVSPEKFETLLHIESLTNPRIRQEMGVIQVIPVEDWVTGPGADFIMSAFTKFSPGRPSRFSDGSYGVYYCAKKRETAIAETVYHREKFMRYTNEDSQLLTMRVLIAELTARLQDIRQKRNELPAIYASENYTDAQALGQELKQSGAWGIAYASVRHEGGECFGIFRPPALKNCQQASYLGYFWDGQKIHVHQMDLIEKDSWLEDI